MNGNAADCYTTIAIVGPDQPLPMMCVCTMTFSGSSLYIVHDEFIEDPDQAGMVRVGVLHEYS